jgi:Flp pilus assembly protein TadG
MRRSVLYKSKSQKGTTAIEMALIAPVFFMLFAGIIEVSLMMLTQHLLESATYNASRLGKTGYVTTGNTQAQMVTASLTGELSALAPLVDITQISLTTTAYNTLSALSTAPGSGTSGVGTAGQIVVYTVSYPWHLFTPVISNIIGDANGNITLTSRMVVQNEPYSN